MVCGQLLTVLIFFACNLMNIVSICAKLQTHTCMKNQHSIRPAAKNSFFSHITCTEGYPPYYYRNNLPNMIFLA